MYHVDEKDFRISKRCYAVLPESLYCQPYIGSSLDSKVFFKCTIDACWYRSKSGVISACVGELWDFQDNMPKDHLEFLAEYKDGRHGGECRSRWTPTELFNTIDSLDGNFWTTVDLRQSREDLNFLRCMLEGYPSIPEGWNGWWRF